MDDRKIIKVAVTPDAKRVIEEFADQFDMKEQGVASRLYMWFSRQPLPIKKWVAGLLDGDEGEGMKLFAEEILGGKEGEGEGRIGSTAQLKRSIGALSRLVQQLSRQDEAGQHGERREQSK